MFVAACVAVIVEEPASFMVTILPDIVATDGLLLVYVKVPLLLEVGADSVNGASPKFFVIMVNLPSVGVIGLTTREAVVVADV